MRLKILLTILIASLNFQADSSQTTTQKRRHTYTNTQNTQRPKRRRYSAQTQFTQNHPKSKRKQKKTESQQDLKPPQEYSSYSNDNYSFCIPSTWQCINDKSQLPEKLDAIFIGQGRGGLTPTINIAQELTNKTSSEYLEEVLAYHKGSESTLESSIFTQIQAHNATFHLLKTEKNTSWGKVYCLQAISILHHTAYIITSTSTQDDYPEVSVHFLKAVASFKLSEKMEAQGDAVLENALKILQQEQTP